MKKTRVLIADDHEVVRQGLRFLLENEGTLEVCGVAISGREAVDQAAELRPDIVVLDMSMPELTGLEAARRIKRASPETEVLIFTANDHEDLVQQVFEAGVKSFIQKADASTHLLDAIRSLREHKPYFTSKTSEVLFARFLERPGAKRGAVTDRERDVLRLLAEGKSNKEVADALGISLRTAETHRANLLQKLRASSLAELVRYAVRHGIVAS